MCAATNKWFVPVVKGDIPTGCQSQRYACHLATRSTIPWRSYHRSNHMLLQSVGRTGRVVWV